MSKALDGFLALLGMAFIFSSPDSARFPASSPAEQYEERCRSHWRASERPSIARWRCRLQARSRRSTLNSGGLDQVSDADRLAACAPCLLAPQAPFPMHPFEDAFGAQPIRATGWIVDPHAPAHIPASFSGPPRQERLEP